MLTTPFADGPHISVATQLSFESTAISAMYPTNTANLLLPKLLYLPSVFLSNKACVSYLHCHSGLSRQKFTSHVDSSHLSALNQPPSLASLSSSITPLLLPSQPSLCSGSLTQTVSTTSDCFSCLQAYTPHRVMYPKCKSDPDTSLLGFSPQSQYISSSHQDLRPPMTSPYLCSLPIHLCSNKTLSVL